MRLPPFIHLQLILLIFLCLVFSGCDKTKETIQETKQGYLELERIIIDIKSALSTPDDTHLSPAGYARLCRAAEIHC